MRKIKEALLAVQMNENSRRARSSTMYLNEICYGNLAYGVRGRRADVLRQARARADSRRSVTPGGLPQVAVRI